MMKKILITGATSMIGRALINVAVSHEIEVYALVRANTNRKDRIIESPYVHIINGNLDRILQIDNLPEDCDTFYHFAWMGTGKTERENPTIQEMNIKYSLDAVELAKKTGCKKFIGAGSQAEYGPTEGAIDDSSRFNPATPYGVSKLAAGKLTGKACGQIGMTHIWCRIFSVYGRYDNEGTMLNYAIDQFLKKEMASFSSCRQTWNYLNEQDAGEVFFRLGNMVDESGEYRIASETNIPLKDYINVIENIMGAKGLCMFANENDEADKPYGINTCDRKLFRDIDYWPKVSFEQGIRDVIEYRKKKMEE